MAKKVKKAKGKFKLTPRRIAIIILVIIQIYLLTLLVKWGMNNHASAKLNEEIVNAVVTESDEMEDIVDEDGNVIASVPVVAIDFDKLFEINSDAVGWIKIGGTNVNYGVVQTTNNSYYLTKTLDNKTNSSGSIFMDYRNSTSFTDQNTVIYGHNMLNGTMFSDVEKIVKNDTGASVITITTPSGTKQYRIFSTYTSEPDSYSIKTQMSTSTYEEFLETVTAKSNKYYGVSVTTDDKILTLSSCGTTSSTRVIVHAKLIN